MKLNHRQGRIRGNVSWPPGWGKDGVRERPLLRFHFIATFNIHVPRNSYHQKTLVLRVSSTTVGEMEVSTVIMEVSCLIRAMQLGGVIYPIRFVTKSLPQVPHSV